jgi:hypothetical protein
MDVWMFYRFVIALAHYELISKTNGGFQVIALPSLEQQTT